MCVREYVASTLLMHIISMVRLVNSVELTSKWILYLLHINVDGCNNLCIILFAGGTFFLSHSDLTFTAPLHPIWNLLLGWMQDPSLVIYVTILELINNVAMLIVMSMYSWHLLLQFVIYILSFSMPAPLD